MNILDIGYDSHNTMNDIHSPIRSQGIEYKILTGDESTISIGETEKFFNSQDNHSDYINMFERAGFLHAFVASLSVIIVSELGDKTFFIAAILAMKNSRLVVFVASMLALGIMTVLASVLGVATTVIPRVYIHYTSVVLFVIFGLKMLKEGFDMSADEAKEELDQVQSTIEKKGHCQTANGSSRFSDGCSDSNDSNNNIYSTEDPETGVIKSLPEVSFKTKVKRKFLVFVSLAFIETFTMIFLAEWGDRSQISTLILAARENVIAVTIGALLGHFLCTGLAVLGGRFIAQMISVKTVTLIGGVVFLMFAAFAALMGE